MKKLLKIKNYQLLFVYIGISTMLYYSTQGAGMVFDFNGWLTLYENGTYSNVLDSFGYQGLHQMEQFLFFSCFKLFGYNHFAWYLSFAFLHSLAAFITYLFLVLFIKTLEQPKAKQIALLSSLLFLISPFASDTVVNKVTIHYFSSFIFMILAFYFEIKFFLTKKWTHIIIIILCFIAALFSLEIAYIFPLLFALLWIALLYFKQELKIQNLIKSPIVIPFIVLAIFLILHKVLLGSFIGHYGAEVHTQFNIDDLFANCIRYFSSYFVLFDYWPYKFKALASRYLVQYAYIFIFLIAVVIALVYYFIKTKYDKLFWIGFLFLTFALFALAPISNLYYAYMFPIENDRYGYFASIFMYAFISFVFFQIEKKRMRRGFILFFILLNSIFTFQNIDCFSKSSKLTWTLLNDFRWFEEEKILCLNDPNNFKGAKMFSTDINPSSFAESLALHTKKDKTKQIYSVMQMNFVQLSDSVIVTQIDSYQYKIQLAQWGNWFWKNMQGANSYENKNFKVNLHKNKGMMYYDLYLKKPMQDATLIYITNNTWQQVKKIKK